MQTRLHLLLKIRSHKNNTYKHYKLKQTNNPLAIQLRALNLKQAYG